MQQKENCSCCRASFLRCRARLPMKPSCGNRCLAPGHMTNNPFGEGGRAVVVGEGYNLNGRQLLQGDYLYYISAHGTQQRNEVAQEAKYHVALLSSLPQSQNTQHSESRWTQGNPNREASSGRLPAGAADNWRPCETPFDWRTKTAN